MARNRVPNWAAKRAGAQTGMLSGIAHVALISL
jgi:hypothetical protein